MAARSISTASLSFGLVTIPIKLYTTKRRESQVSFHWLHAKCGSRVNMQWYCAKDDEVVERKDLVRGFEVSKGKHVAVENEELDATREEKRDDIGIIEFVPVDTINPLYYDHGYYLAPDRHGDKAYAILSRALERSERVAIGRYAARGDEHVVAIQAQDGALIMFQLKFADEIRSIDDIPIPSTRVAEKELDLADQLIRHHAADAFDPGQYKDEVKLRKLKLIEDKLEAGAVSEEPAAKGKGKGKGAEDGEVVDLMAALKASLGAVGGRAANSNRGRKPAARATVPRHRTTRKAAKRTSAAKRATRR
jgi:DNA end-binding protein Ku